MQEAETKAKNMEQAIERLHVELEERDEQLKASANSATKVPFPTLFLTGIFMINYWFRLSYSACDCFTFLYLAIKFPKSYTS